MFPFHQPVCREICDVGMALPLVFPMVVSDITNGDVESCSLVAQHQLETKTDEPRLDFTWHLIEGVSVCRILGCFSSAAMFRVCSVFVPFCPLYIPADPGAYSRAGVVQP